MLYLYEHFYSCNMLILIFFLLFVPIFVSIFILEFTVVFVFIFITVLSLYLHLSPGLALYSYFLFFVFFCICHFLFFAYFRFYFLHSTIFFSFSVFHFYFLSLLGAAVSTVYDETMEKYVGIGERDHHDCCSTVIAICHYVLLYWMVMCRVELCCMVWYRYTILLCGVFFNIVLYYFCFKLC
jgi:hypothetical protein